jgi:hypothetical protein
MLDQNRKPNAGPFGAGATMVELDPLTKRVTRNFEYYMYGHFSKYVRTGAVRVASNSSSAAKSLDHVAFVNAATARGVGNAGTTVLVAVNTGFEAHELRLQCGPRLSSVARLPARSIATFRWKQPCAAVSGSSDDGFVEAPLAATPLKTDDFQVLRGRYVRSHISSSLLPRPEDSALPGAGERERRKLDLRRFKVRGGG